AGGEDERAVRRARSRRARRGRAGHHQPGRWHVRPVLQQGTGGHLCRRGRLRHGDVQPLLPRHARARRVPGAVGVRGRVPVLGARRGGNRRDPRSRARGLCRSGGRVSADRPGARLETLAVHAGAEPDPQTGAVAPPIHLSTTFQHGPAAERVAGYEYQREGNPTQDRLETALAALEGGAAALAYASGMAAISGLLEALSPGAHVLLPDDCYSGTRYLATGFLPQRGVSARFVDMSDLDAVHAACSPAPALLWVETPSNPLMKICDIAALAGIAQAHGAILCCDNTFATPVLQQPLALGADVVMHSTTKYFGGHSDVLGGALVFARRDALFDTVAHRRHITGGVLSPFS